MSSLQVPTKIDLTPRRHHAYTVLIFIIGTLLPPLAVAARFGFGGDFWLNVLLTLCGYIPGHGHNFYIQNIRNNKNHRRTPKWAQRYGLVDTSEIKRKAKKSQWAGRYNDRLPQSTLENAPYEEGQDHGSSIDNSSENGHSRGQGEGLWRPEDESYYGEQGRDSTSARTSGSSGRWHYPANFEDTVPSSGGSSKKSGKKKKDKKDRWARTEDAYSLSEEQTKRKKSKRKKSKSTLGDSSLHTNDSTEFPEDAEGGLYGDRRAGQTEANGGATKVEDVFSHQF